MATILRKAMLYLGLGPDEEYDDYDPGYDDPPSQGGSTRSRPAPQPAYQQGGAQGSGPEETSAIGAVRPVVTGTQSRPDPSFGPSAPVVARARSGVVRPIAVTPNAKPHVVVPTSFNQAQEVADKFKGNQPVIVNLQAAERDLARRLIDFNSGLCYGLGGQMEKVANQVYLLTPSNVEVSAEERRRLHERGYDT
ncbi:MAG: cell division protein SepF [Acidimicrobiales bacterium]